MQSLIDEYKATLQSLNTKQVELQHRLKYVKGVENLEATRTLHIVEDMILSTAYAIDMIIKPCRM